MDMRVSVGGVTFKNPVITASGTFGSGREYAGLVDLNRLGGVVTKGVSAKPWAGNETIRIAETPSGMLNAIGLQNPGVETFLKEDLPFLRNFDTRVIVNVCGHTREEYIEAVRLLSVPGIDMLEINISCPNVKEGGIAFGTDPDMVYDITRAVKEETSKPVIMKLSPNVTDITKTAAAAERGGADAVSLINTITGMKIDIEKGKFLLANKTGGLSGPAIHPVAVRMVYEVSNAVSIPVIGMGGIMNGGDAIEMIMAGASLTAVGTANFSDPLSTVRILEETEAFMERKGYKDLSEIRGIVSR